MSEGVTTAPTADVGTQLSALADPTRRSIYELIRKSPLSVRQVTDRVAISQPAVSQHLKVLYAAGLADRTARGASTIYRADFAGLAVIREWIDDMWDDVLDAFVEAAHHEHERNET